MPASPRQAVFPVRQSSRCAVIRVPITLFAVSLYQSVDDDAVVDVGLFLNQSVEDDVF